MDKNRYGLIAWCFYDWANSAFPTVITTFVFSAYFTKRVAADELSGTSQWGIAISLSALMVALIGPILGAIADHLGRRKPWLLGFTLVASISAMMLWTVKPMTNFAIYALCWVALANFAFEMGMIFYNAMLPDLAPKKQLGRWSGWGWGLGYFGGLTCLSLVLVAFVQTDTPLFDLNKGSAEELRITGPFVAAWMLFFALPLFCITPDTRASTKPIIKLIKESLNALIQTFRKLRDFKDIAWFLLARMLYTDGLNTLFTFGGIYAAGTFGFSFESLIIFGIGINITAGLGAVGFAWLDDKIGAKKMILISIAGLIVLSTALLFSTSTTLFWIFGLTLGFFVGPAQSSSRSLLAHLAPRTMSAKFFGLYALSGKATAFLGPAFVAWATTFFESQRAGMATILIFLLAGMIAMIKVPSVKY